LANGIWLPSVQEYKIRCQRHSYGTKFTVAQIIAATSRMREEFGYRGELVIGDLSKRSGGAYGPHRSHQNGRDVDVWLPIRGGKYKRDPQRCRYCNTDYCRPDPSEVDWDATWQLVKALAAIGHDKESPVKEIFLDRTLHSELADAARRDGISETDVRRYVQYRGRNALVKDSPGHVHHMHVRFRCGEDTDSCIE
jgi:murein endopeptidase